MATDPGRPTRRVFAAARGAPWLGLTAVGIAMTVLRFNFVGDGLRDAADPHR